MAAPTASMPAQLDVLPSPATVDAALARWRDAPVSDAQLVALVQSLAVLERRGFRSTTRHRNVEVVVAAQVAMRQAAGRPVPNWVTATMRARYTPATRYNKSMMKPAAATAMTTPGDVLRAVMSFQDVVTAPSVAPVVAYPAIIRATPPVLLTASSPAPPPPSPLKTFTAVRPPTFQEYAPVHGVGLAYSPSQLASVGQVDMGRAASAMHATAARLDADARSSSDPVRQRRAAIRATAARLIGRQRALRQAVLQAGGALAAADACSPPTVLAIPSSSDSRWTRTSVHGTHGLRTMSAALLARSDSIRGVTGNSRSADGLVQRPVMRPPTQNPLFATELASRTLVEAAAARSRRAVYLKAVLSHARTVRDRHRHGLTLLHKLAKGCRHHLEGFQKEKEKAATRLERARLKALHDGKYDEFKKLVETTKNKRLQHLLDQTDKYLGDIGKLVQAQQDAAMAASRAPLPIEVDRMKRKRKGKGRAGAGAGAGSGAGSGTPTDGVEASGEGELAPPQLERSRSRQQDYYRMAHAKQEQVLAQPEMLVGGTLKKYQLAGLQWLVSLYNNNLNGILADEMGLGKTIQTIALITYIMEVKQNNGPFLIVVPLSTISNWANEFAKWAPAVVVVVYKGTPAKRKEIYQRHMSGGQFNVVLTTYTFTMRDKSVLRKLRYQYIIIDEGHRMKNAHCKFSRILGQQYHSRNRVLLTGTPLQNNLPELWALLNFLLPKVFNSVENFDTWFSKPFQNFGGTAESRELTLEENLVVINRLHQVLRPFLLRRVKSEVLGQLPGKVERVLRCEMSAWQKIVYKQIQEHGQLISRNKTGTKALANVLMHLRKICNHPYLFNEEDNFPINDNLWRTSGKFELLDRILPKLKAAGHRVLVFSQMTRLIDVMEDYLHFRRMRYLRLDGHTTADDREQRMLQFNAPDSPYFIFLLSTRAGGLGVNLATADTVIIFDSDWNPTMDLQAQDRAHRIGQTREVHVFRLATNTPVEDRILARAHDKRTMEDLVINAGQFNAKSSAAQRRAMLEDMLEAETNQADDDIMTDESINELMMRTEEELELYQRLDREREEQDRKSWAMQVRAGVVTGEFCGRLMTEPEVPDHVKVPAEVFDEAARKEAELATYGRGSRERKDVKYTDGMTDTQFMAMIQGDGNIEKYEQRQQRVVSRKRAAPTAAPTGSTQPKAKKKRVRNRRYKPGSRNDPRMKAAMKRFNRLLLPSWEVVRAVEDDKGSNELSQLFLNKPSRVQYPDYYEIIKRPLGMNDIKRKMQSSRYRNRGEYEHDFDTLFQNAMDYNREGSAVHSYAQRMKAAFHEAVADVPFSMSLTTKRSKAAEDEDGDGKEAEDAEDAEDAKAEAENGGDSGAADNDATSTTAAAAAAPTVSIALDVNVSDV